jgi:hypothetical protein
VAVAPPPPAASAPPALAAQEAPAPAAVVPLGRVEVPHVELAHPDAPPPVSPGAAEPPLPARAGAARAPASPAPRREPDFAVVTPPPEIYVLRTSWHPRAERRLARVRLGGASGPVEVREGDAISTLVVKAIEPSGVVFLHGGRELRREVRGE